jgi:hypothetical protein
MGTSGDPGPPARQTDMSRQWKTALAGRGPAFALLVGLAACSGGCAEKKAGVELGSPELAAYVQLVMPTRIELQRYWTKPVSFAGNENADGLEIILAAYDSSGDLTKIVGTLHFELYTRRMASSDRLGERIAFWTVELNSRDALTRYWDPLARFYRFPVRLSDKPLAAGQYILQARLVAPDGERLFDEHEFTYESGTAPAAKAGR